MLAVVSFDVWLLSIVAGSSRSVMSREVRVDTAGRVVIRDVVVVMQVRQRRGHGGGDQRRTRRDDHESANHLSIVFISKRKKAGPKIRTRPTYC